MLPWSGLPQPHRTATNTCMYIYIYTTAVVSWCRSSIEQEITTSCAGSRERDWQCCCYRQVVGAQMDSYLMSRGLLRVEHWSSTQHHTALAMAWQRWLLKHQATNTCPWRCAVCTPHAHRSCGPRPRKDKMQHRESQPPKPKTLVWLGFTFSAATAEIARYRPLSSYCCYDCDRTQLKKLPTTSKRRGSQSGRAQAGEKEKENAQVLQRPPATAPPKKKPRSSP